MTDKLKPCPFCGGEIEIVNATQNIDEDHIIARCTCCNFTFEYSTYFAHSKIARVKMNPSFVEAWNTRKPIDKIVEQLEEEVIWANTHGTDAMFRQGRVSGLLTAKRFVKGGAE